jgi:uncharacterized Zn-binding protein involved in type VI secretion
MNKPAARVGDMHTCPLSDGPKPHAGGPILPPGCLTVIICGQPAARVGDRAACVGPPDIIAQGSLTVLIGSQFAARQGDITVHGGVITMGCPTVLIGDTSNVKLGAEPLSPDLADAVFTAMTQQSDIAFKYPTDGCYARAHLMAQRMELMGLTPKKVWSFASDYADPLWVNTPNHPAGKVSWGYHVAPTIPIRGTDGKVQDMVVDPSMFNQPATIDEWRNAQHDKPTIIQTKLGEPPIPQNGGSGYWPSQDPIEGKDKHAYKTMKKYKRYEKKN